MAVLKSSFTLVPLPFLSKILLLAKGYFKAFDAKTTLFEQSSRLFFSLIERILKYHPAIWRMENSKSPRQI
jgi:hypothetical protein